MKNPVVTDRLILNFPNCALILSIGVAFELVSGPTDWLRSENLYRALPGASPSPT